MWVLYLFFSLNPSLEVCVGEGWGKGIPEVRRAAFQAMGHWEHRLRREHLPQGTISLQSHPAPGARSSHLLLQSTQAVLPM